ncbi:MAG: hypothetical protein R6W90_08065 [Ignavibacteriaceae bacterium]
MKKLLLLFLLGAGFILAQPKYSEQGPGAFSRMGFGARGIGMGNAMSAVTEGNLAAYYNPAVSVFQLDNSFQTSYSFLSMDRSLNFLNYTRRFEFYSVKDTAENRKPRSTAGLSVGIINAGVSNITEYDNSGAKSGEVSTSENMAFLGLANRFSEKISIGITVKFFYYKLYEDVSSTGFGIDLGGLYMLSDHWNISLMFSNINSKYKWDTGTIYEQSGSNYEEKFPVSKKVGTSYTNASLGLIASAEFESYNKDLNIARFGIEYNIYENLFLRGGIDQWNLSNSDYPVKPAAGFSYAKYFGSLKIGVDYAFMVEQYSSQDRHIVGLSFQF